MPTLTNRERRALMTVALVIVLSAVVQWIRPHEAKTKQYDYTLQDSLFKALSADTAQAILSEKHPQKLERPEKVRRVKSRKSMGKALIHKSINPNTATAAELQRLPHIGPKTAEAIVQYRQEHGPFKSIEELDNVKRIGPKTIKRIRPFLILPQEKSKSDSARNKNLP